MDAKATDCTHGLVGQSPRICRIRTLIEKAARCRFPVLLLGETGTGKDVVARAIHRASQLPGRFVAIDCGTLSATLIESELFGHVRGAFTGAAEARPGLIEEAAGGTAFFDEIGDLPLELQVKLLRLVQEGEYRPVGSTKPKKSDARIIAATHRDLPREVAKGRFREDLLYRLMVLKIEIPPLRDRREDIPLLVEHFMNGSGLRLDDAVRVALATHDWPGNVRQLQHSIERMMALNSDGVLRLGDLPTTVQYALASGDLRRLAEAVDDDDLPVVEHRSPPASLAHTEERAIKEALIAAGGDRKRASQSLGIGRTTLYRKLKKYGIDS